MSKGLSLLELLIAFAVASITLTASASVGLTVPAIIADAKSAAAAIESAHLFISIKSDSLSAEPLEDEQFERLIATSTWTDSRSESRTALLSTITSTSDEPEACDPFTSGDWAHPRFVETSTLGELGAPDGAYTISSLAIAPGLLAVGIASTSRADAPTTLLFRLVGTSSPRIAGMFDNASTSRIGDSAVAMHANFVFAGSAFSSSSTTTCAGLTNCSQIAVYSPDSITPVSSFVFATSSEPFTYQNDGSPAPVSALTYHQDFLFVGLQKTAAGDEFNILDAHDSTHLKWIAGYPIGRTVNNITVRDGLAYVSTDDPTRELMIFDVHDPHHPSLYSSWDAPGTSTFGYGNGSTVYGNTVRFGRTYSASTAELELLQLNDGSVSELANLDSGTSKDPESVRALLTQDRFTFTLLTHKLEVLNTQDHAHVLLAGTFDLPAGSEGVALACRNNQLYLAWNAADGTGHIDILQGS